MRDTVLGIIEKMQTAMKADDAELKLVNIGRDGSVTLRIKGLCGSSHAELWTHRLRVERAFKEKMPDTSVIFS